MKLSTTRSVSPLEDGPQIKAVEEVTTPALVGICLGSTFFLITLAAVSCFCYRRRITQTSQKLSSAFKKNHQEKPLVLRKPTAVKSPSSGPAGPILKKSPSPTLHKHPPGQRSPPGTTSSGGPQDNDGKGIGECKSPQQQLQQQRPAGPLVEGKQQVVSKPCNENEKEQAEKENIKYNKEEECDDKEKEVVVEKTNKLGKLHFKLKYNAEKHALQVTIVRCNDLPAKDPNIGTSDPYVKLQLLPEKQHKVKTRVLRKTLNPVYDEDFTFYGINPNQLQATTLHFVVLSFDRYSRDDVIGEVICPLSGVDFESLGKQLSLSKDITPRNLKIRYQGRGELLVSLCYQPAANRLTVVVLKARNLPKMDFTGLCDPYVKIYLLYNNQRIAKKKTHVKKRTVNPVFNESFVFEVPYNEGLENISLEFLVLDWDRVTKNEVIGRLELGPRSGGAAQQHWNEVCNSPRRQIAEWHKLRE